ncbi:MAG: ABC transporter ATP-binding protein [Mageeibacillus sp.]|nr:ABC transporter ATP-binding protein [Mageeibacillus sp.]MCI1264327.1 ABC transporter ATP-binding protein [Saccharofermentans sp.]
MNTRHTHLVKVHDLSIAFPGVRNPDPVPVVKNIEFGIRDGEILGLIGNSGSGKTMTAMAIAGLLPDSARIISGRISFAGENLLTMNRRRRRMMLGSDIGVIFQEPSTALDPLCKVGKSLDEILECHGNKDRADRRAKILAILSMVGFTDPEDIYIRYPHQLSGGQRQRVLIAGAALLSPKLLICDEPTSSLDTVTTVAILALLKDICHRLHMTVLFISHDLSAVRNFCDRVIVMRGGEIVDRDSAEEMLSHPHSGYTAELLTNARLDPRTLGLTRASVDYSSSPILTARHLAARYDNSAKTVLSDINLDIYPHEILGLIGSSGCGKTTLSKTVLGLIPHTGSITCTGGRIGAVFQDPVSCLNPAHSVMWHLKEPLIAARKRMSSRDMKIRIEKALTDVGLGSEYLTRLPSALSGGQRQRVAIAMCLILEPFVIMADEPFSSLDASSASEILKLLPRINREKGTSIVLITHNIHIVRQICPRVIVMDRGSVCEEGLTSEVLQNPQSEALCNLLNAERRLHGDNH